MASRLSIAALLPPWADWLNSQTCIFNSYHQNDAGIGRYHAVVHDLVPVFTGDDAEQQHDGVQRRLEVGLSEAARPHITHATLRYDWVTVIRSSG